MRKRIFSLMLLLVLVGSLCLSVSALETPDFHRLGSISIAMTHNEKPVPGGSLTIYRVADIVWNNGYEYQYTEDFSDCTLPLTDLNSADLAEDLARVAREKRLTGITKELNRQGKCEFSDLQLGLYLVVQKEAARGYHKINPYLVSVPQMEGDNYIYNVDTAPKNLPEPDVKPTEPKPTEPRPTWPSYDKLPQTGQTNWPVPVMAVAGMLLVIGGFCLRSSGKRKQDET